MAASTALIDGLRETLQFFLEELLHRLALPRCTGGDSPRTSFAAL